MLKSVENKAAPPAGRRSEQTAANSAINHHVTAFKTLDVSPETCSCGAPFQAELGLFSNLFSLLLGDGPQAQVKTLSRSGR